MGVTEQLTRTPESLFDRYFGDMPLIAILRGLAAEQALAVGEAILEAGIRLLEVPLNSPVPYDSIDRLVRATRGRALVGAGTVYTVDEANKVAAAGGSLIVSPNVNPAVIARTRALGLVSLPGVFTPTEAAAALEAGAHALKLFPGELVTHASAKALAAILPPGTRLILVGGVGVENIAVWRVGAVHGFGVGSALYAPGLPIAEVAARARHLVRALRPAERQQ